MDEKHFCRCCLSEECYKDMANDYYFGKITENYFDMLLHIFNINITNNDEQRSLICEDCVFKLRDAAAFKKKVLDVQEIMRKNLHLVTNSKDIGINIKTMTDEEDNFDGFINDNDDSFNENDIKWENNTSDTSQKGKCFVIKLESNRLESSIETYSSFKRELCKNESEQQGSQKTLLLDTNYDLNSHKMIRENFPKISRNIDLQESVKTSNEPTVNDDGASDFENSDCREDNNDKYMKPLSSCKDKDLDIGETSKSIKRKGNPKNNGDKGKRKKRKADNSKELSQTELCLRYKSGNTMKLIQNSNLCLFRSYQNKFGCQYCRMKFNDINQLKEHTVTHVNPQIARQVNRLKGLSCKNAEISDLKCNLCSEKCNDLPHLMEHLKTKHKIAFQGKDHYLVPYKLHDGFQCALCELKFNTYLRLSIHMNTHYTNNVCEMCGLSYINRQSLLSHVNSQHKEKKCSQCPAIFLTSAAKTKHLRQAHGVRNVKSYCNVCNETFPHSYMVREHKIKEHGFERETFSCTQCNKSFWTSIHLKIHIRSVHIKERNYPCSKCSKRFFTTCDQRRHEKTHEELPSYCCSYCDAKFKSKDSWRRHLKRQHGHVFEKKARKT